ncbi:hypothetical protein GYMLUDRAFT_906443 [Collybiopsis luxurians FD-317 M1]|uniref:Uncharacterized protein n=1 Tax=Collybiopsis luxurians FD-317 M1 TaxID=944289 RepID=A0A0D0AUT0_9AGAR|nr:hypothetical protein GYMLUDRAFT_906443 [Collybiopsis luxurians FD-317 M1]
MRQETEEQKDQHRERNRGYRERNKADPVKWAGILEQKKISERNRRARKKAEHLQTEASGSGAAPTIDLVSDIVGKQIHPSAALQKWPNGWVTPLPTLVRSFNGQDINILDRDARHVKWMADPRNVTQSQDSLVQYFEESNYTDDMEKIEGIRNLLAKGNVVVLRNSVQATGKKISTFRDIERFAGGWANGQKVQVHGKFKYRHYSVDYYIGRPGTSCSRSVEATCRENTH